MYGQIWPKRFAPPGAAPRPLVWLAALIAGILCGLALTLVSFVTGAVLVTTLGNVSGWLLLLVPSLDPVYTHAAQRSLADLRLEGLAVIGPLGEALHAALPDVFVPAARAHWAIARIAVEPGSPVLARLLAAGIAHACVLSAGLMLVCKGWRQHRSGLLIAGAAMQVQVAIGILGAQPSIRELDATGLSFAANAVVPWLVPRNAALSDGPQQAWPALVAGALVGLALLVGYLPTGLMLVTRDRTRRITLATAAVVMLGSAACAGALTHDAALAGPAELPAVVGPAVIAEPPAAPPLDPAPVPAPVMAAAYLSASDRWFEQPDGNPAARPSRVQVVGSDFRYQYVVNGEPQVIKGMGLNTQYTQLLSPSDRAAHIESDLTALSAMGINTVLGWDPAEFDTVLLDAAQRHGLGVVMPFDLDPAADYTDPAVRQQLHDEVLAWVTRYRNHPAVRMWGLGNEVLHKIVHPAWLGPQDPQREIQAEAFSDWLIQTADDIHQLDPNHPVTYRSAEDAFVGWVVTALDRRGGGPRPWFVWGANCYQAHLGDIVDHWTQSGMPTALWISEFAPGGLAVPDRPDGFARMWGYVRRNPDWVLGGAVYAWTRNGPEGVDRNFGLTDDGVPVDGRSLDMLTTLFHSE
jgi:Glycosyl hydrolases family 2, TIM barrel domain